MNGNFELLLECMTRENKILDDIANLSLSKRQVIILGDVKELQAMIRQEAGLLTALNKVEAERLKYQIDLGKEHSIDTEKLTAAELQKVVIDKFYREQAGKFKSQIETMTATMSSIRQLNQLNAELLNHSLAYIESMENILSRVNSTVYSSSGEVVEEADKRRKILDKSV